MNKFFKQAMGEDNPDYRVTARKKACGTRYYIANVWIDNTKYTVATPYDPTWTDSNDWAMKRMFLYDSFSLIGSTYAVDKEFDDPCEAKEVACKLRKEKILTKTNLDYKRVVSEGKCCG